ncbi:NAD(P)/FAD-dependent oxidoreductase [Halorhabdus sp. CBA1104]|uniref:NAD(P)/FAD-dependent oxidoreductase n=1 Tax=unclassified Halorhabdus TaxID=2621901 RepID=UPI0012B43D84|nr:MULTISPECIES: NAD(P)/FAD-dependent oxidoreductase [unclassified Halorhabdus]QGN07883.1 NAD(P)/FAD-dependent oxidoreductase [Halorhabdus sp. CBA1104]
MTDATGGSAGEYDHDVVVIGGGPAGCSAGIFTARYGLDTLVFDRGRSSIRRCAHLENYPGFPAGIDIETFYGRLHDHIREAGCALREDLVESVTALETPAAGGFVVDPQEGEQVTARRVIAATRYDGEYLWPLDADSEMITTSEDDGEETEQFKRDYPNADGSTPIEGLYVATPSDADEQAIIAAGRGAATARTLLRDHRRASGIPETLADHYDWVRRRAQLDEEWHDRETWREYLDDRVGEAAGETWTAATRTTEIDRILGSYIDDDEIANRRERGQDRLLEHVDDERVLARAREIEAARDADTERDNGGG